MNLPDESIERLFVSNEMREGFGYSGRQDFRSALESMDDSSDILSELWAAVFAPPETDFEFPFRNFSDLNPMANVAYGVSLNMAS